VQRHSALLAVPKVVGLPVGLLLLVWLQFALGRLPSLSQAGLFSVYLMGSGLLMLLGHALRVQWGLPKLTKTLAIFLLCGAQLAALQGIAQHDAWGGIWTQWVLPKTSSAVYGNLAQPNQFADYLSLGLISLGLLFARQSLRVGTTALLAAPLLFALVLSGSRSAAVYWVALTAMAFVWQRRAHRATPWLRYNVAVLLGFALMHWVVQLPLLSSASDSITSVQRLLEGSGMSPALSNAASPLVPSSASNTAHSSGQIRLGLWQESWVMWTQFPLLGAGMGQFAWQHFQLAPVLQNVHTGGAVSSYAHNLFLQIAAEMGLLGLSIFCLTLLLWLRQARQTDFTLEQGWGYALLWVLFLHSQVEYPLWYAFFLGVAALLLGAFDQRTYRWATGKPLHIALLLILLAGSVALAQLWHTFRQLEALSQSVPPMALRDGSEAQRAVFQRIQRELTQLHNHSLLLGNETDAMLSEMGWDHVADKLVLNEQVLRFAPIPSAAFREAQLLARMGRQDEAQLQIQRAIWSYPDKFPFFQSKLTQFAKQDPDPARFPALLTFANAVYAERQRVVLARP
jgi:O-antigen ligase